jgi:hypothetical protein
MREGDHSTTPAGLPWPGTGPLIPLKPGTKVPAVVGWAKPDYVGVESGSDLGLRCDGLVVVDCDSLEAARQWLDSRPAPTKIVKTPRGYHFYYQATPDSQIGPMVGVLPGVDIRAGMGSFVVVPPTPGYREMPHSGPLVAFDPAWLPSEQEKLLAEAQDGWDTVPEGRRNNTLTAMAGMLRKQGASETVMLATLNGINRALCSPPLPDDEVRSIVRSIARYPSDPDDEIAPTDRTPLGDDPSRLAPVIFTDEELEAMELPPAKWIVPGLIPAGVTLLAGKPKVGKSWLALSLAQAVAEGAPCFGRTVEGGAVLYLALEDTRTRLRNRLRKLRARPTGRLSFSTSWTRLPNGETFIEDWLTRTEEPLLIVVDVFALLRHEAAKPGYDYADDYKAMRILKQIADKHEVAVVVLHHERKLAADDPLDSVSGTTGLTGSVDTILVLQRGRTGHKLVGRGRDLEQEIELDLHFDPATARFAVAEIATQRVKLSSVDALEWIARVTPIGARILPEAELYGLANQQARDGSDGQRFTRAVLKQARTAARTDPRFEAENPNNPRSPLRRVK